MKSRVICVSRELTSFEAVDFARHFKDLFHPLFLYARDEEIGRRAGFQRHYYVVRIPPYNEETVPGHEMTVDLQNILGTVHITGLSDLKQRAGEPLHLVLNEST